MPILKLKNRNFRIEPIPSQTAFAFSKVIGRKMGLPFVPMAVYYCDRKPGLAKLPKGVDLGPSPFFNGTDVKGKTNKRKEARNKAGVFSVFGIKKSAQLKALLVEEIGQAKVDVPAKQIIGLLPTPHRLVFGLYVAQKYFQVIVHEGPSKGASFVMGLPYALEWGMWQVGTCGEMVSVETVEGP